MPEKIPDPKLISISRMKRALKELKFVRSAEDFKILAGKVVYIVTRSFPPRLLSNQKPLSLQIEPTNYCNVDCSCCSAPLSTRPKGFMRFDLFTRIIDEAILLGVKRILLYLHGEPLLHPMFEEMLKYIKSNHLAVTVFTNGMSLSGEKVDRILQAGMNSGDYFTISMLGHSKAMHEMIMKRVIHERVVDQTIYFWQSREKLRLNGPIIQVIYQLTPENAHELKDFRTFWESKVDHVITGDLISYSFSRDEGKKAELALRNRSCKVLWDRMTILWNGDIDMCCVDINGEYILGNLEKQSLLEIWNSKHLREIKKIHLVKDYKKIPICATCDM
jgi:radical SAM protein with 4Fe4S-binding SPASM domain